MNPAAISLIVFFSLILLAYSFWKWNVLSRLFRNQAKYKARLKEDVLKTLYKVKQSNRSAELTSLANALQIRTGKLLNMVEELVQEDFIETAGSDLILTEKGSRKALEIIRTHRIWETHLAERTGIDKKAWHDLAEKKEHLLSIEETETIYHELGNPRFDPHGDPIPTQSGELPSRDTLPLSVADPGTPMKIVHIEDEPDVVYKQITDHQLFVGSHLNVIESTKDLVRFECEGEIFQLSSIVASNISVKELSDLDDYEASKVRLSALQLGENARIVGISAECRGANRRRLLDLGFVRDTPIHIEFEGPLNDPRAYSIKNTLIALRKDQADHVLIEKTDSHG